MKQENTQTKPTYNLMPYKQEEKINKINFNSNIKEYKERIKELKKELKKKTEEIKQEIKESQEKARTKYKPLTQELYLLKLEDNKEMALNHNWEIIGINDKKNIYTEENLKKAKAEKEKSREDFFKELDKKRALK